MNPFPASLTRNPVAFAPVHNHRRAAPMWQDGQTISAVLESIKDGTAALRTQDDVLFHADAAAIRGEVGERLTFSVRRTAEGFALTQVDSAPAPPAPARAVSMDEIKDFTQTMEGIKENNEYRTQSLEEQNAKTARAVAAIRRSQSFISKTGGKSAVAAIVESGLDLTKISFAALERIMQTINRAPTQPGAGDERFLTRANGAEMVTALHKHGLPVNERNITILARAWEKIPRRMSDPATAYIVTEEAAITPDNLYKALYTAPEKPAGNTADAPAAPAPPDWEHSRTAIESLFARVEIPPTDENLTAARFLLARDLPITRENVERVVFLNDLPAHHSNANVREAFFGQAAQFIAQDRQAGTISLPEVVRMAEAQLLLATQAAARHTNLHIDTDALRENLYALTQQEAEVYMKIARALDADTIVGRSLSNEAAPLIDNGSSRLVSLFDTLGTLRPLTVNVHANIISGSPFTIEGVHSSLLAARANADYTQHATVPSSRYGDSFAQVKAQFEPLLTGMGISPTSENMKAAFILSRNKMDVDAQNLHAVKEIDGKITAIANKLHPLIAANMLKEGLNPLEMHADQLLAYIRQFNYDMGEDGAKKIARYIREMDENRTLDSDTRRAMISVYRMLHVIQKDGSAALGLAAQMNAPLTLGNLLDLAQNWENRRRAPTDITVDDAMGELERIIRPQGSIRAAIMSGTAPALSHLDVIADTFADAAPPTVLEKLLQSSESMAHALEDLAAEAAEQAAAKPPPPPAALADAAEALQTFAAAHADTIFKLQNRNFSAKPGNIAAAEELEDNPRALEDFFEKRSNVRPFYENFPATDLAALRDTSPAQIMARIYAALGGSSAPDNNRIQSLLAVTHGLNGDAQQGFDLPVRMGGRISHLKMYVVGDGTLTADGARVFLSLDTARLGTVSAYFTVSHTENGDTALTAAISAETAAARDALLANQSALHELAQRAGVQLGEITFTLTDSHEQR